uniref:Uncharacterized protein n=1 Tax=Coccidioides posadasii RMSCC 3488 TaxID=454284 RepID=A0A0J6FEM3_COCPO|nr:hypothetical protein CPAG_03693 [Coccidioides posadasii RMSCC 3488]
MDLRGDVAVSSAEPSRTIPVTGPIYIATYCLGAGRCTTLHFAAPTASSSSSRHASSGCSDAESPSSQFDGKSSDEQQPETKTLCIPFRGKGPRIPRAPFGVSLGNKPSGAYLPNLIDQHCRRRILPNHWSTDSRRESRCF